MVVTQLQAFQQLVTVHESVCHAKGEPHRGCSVCESLRAPSAECRQWAMTQPVGIELLDIPYTNHYLNTQLL